MLKGEKIPVKYIDLMGSRSSGKSVACFALLIIICQLFTPQYVGMCGFRASQNDSKMLLDDFVNTLESYDINYTTHASKGTVKLFEHSLRFYGLNSMRGGNCAKKAGLPRFSNVKYVIIFFEERFEFSNEDISSVKQAIRSTNPDTQFIYLSACNPWSKEHEYIKELLSFQPFDINVMKTTGSQIGIYEYTLKDESTGIEIKEKRLIQYTNWRILRDILPKQTITTILNTWKENKTRAATVDYGLPGYEEGAIYTHLMHCIGPAQYIEQEYLLCGVDYGWGRTSDTGKTVAIFGGATIDGGIDLYNEYVQSNHHVEKSVNQVAKEIVEFFINSMGDYTNACGYSAPFPISIRVDNANVGVIQMLNNTASMYRVNHWMKFIKCKKFPVDDRIEITLGLMGIQKLRFSNKIKLLKSEMETAYYEDGATRKRVKKDDHALNAFEYAIEPVMYKLSKNINSLVGKKIWVH